MPFFLGSATITLIFYYIYIGSLNYPAPIQLVMPLTGSDRIFDAFLEEANMASQQIGFGATAIGKANYVRKAQYYQAFFALSIGFERAAKIALIADSLLENNGNLLSYEEIKDYGHSLKELLNATDEISVRRKFEEENHRLPRGQIHVAIIDVLNQFAKTSRYFNIDYLTGSKYLDPKSDSLKLWHKNVTLKVIEMHYSKRKLEKDEVQAEFVDTIISPITLSRHFMETGEYNNSIKDQALSLARSNFSAPYVRMYVLQIARFLAHVNSELGYLAMQTKGKVKLPYFSDVFSDFFNDDRYFKTRKIWEREYL